MTPAIRYLVLTTLAAAACACSDAEPTRSAEKPPVQEAPRVVLPSAREAASTATLSATKPPPATSIVDAPVEPKSQPELIADPFAHDEPEQADMIDFDRSLDPGEVKIDRFVLATDVQGREPLGETDTFDSDTKKIFAFVQLANGEGLPYAFRVHWEPLDGPATPYGVKLEVPTAARFRTWSWTRIERAPGHYKAVLRTLDGAEIARREFVIEASAGDH